MKEFVLFKKVDNMYYRKPEDSRYYKVLGILNKIEIDLGVVEYFATIASDSNKCQREIIEIDYSKNEFYSITEGKNPVSIPVNNFTKTADIDCLINRAIGYKVSVHENSEGDYYLYYFNGKSADRMPISNLGNVICDINEDKFWFEKNEGNIKFYDSEDDVYKWNPYTKVEHGQEIIIPGKYELLVPDDKQLELIDKFKRLVKEMKAAGIESYYDETYGKVRFVNSNNTSHMSGIYYGDNDKTKDCIEYSDICKLPCVGFASYLREEYDIIFDKRIKTNQGVNL